MRGVRQHLELTNVTSSSMLIQISLTIGPIRQHPSSFKQGNENCGFDKSRKTSSCTQIGQTKKLTKVDGVCLKGTDCETKSNFLQKVLVFHDIFWIWENNTYWKGNWINKSTSTRWFWPINWAGYWAPT